MTGARDREPWVTWLFAGSIVAVAGLATGFDPTPQSLGPWLWSRHALAAGQWDRLFLSMFAHGGVLHLLLNLVGLLSFGTLVERSFGHARFAALYLVSGVAGNFAHALYGPDIPAVGASGAIFGLLGLLLILQPRMQVALFSIIPMPLVLFGAGYAALLPVLTQYSSVLPIAHEAHLGGMVAGAVAGLAFDPGRALRVLPAGYGIFLLISVGVAGFLRGEANPWFYLWIVVFLVAAFAYLRWLDRRLVQVTCDACEGTFAVHRRGGGRVTRTRCPHCRTRSTLGLAA